MGMGMFFQRALPAAVGVQRSARKGIVTSVMAIVRYKRKPGDPLTRRQKENLKRIAEIKDEDIDLSDIPELTDE
jgi:hypothetical protein